MLVTGASSGIGKVCAEHFHDHGWKVYGASRSIQSVDSLLFAKISMDVTDDESVNQGVGHIVEQEGQLDAVVHCAGIGIAGAIEDTSIEEAKAQFETNFFGVVRVCQAVLPTMRQQRSGFLIMMSSLGGLAAVPFQGFYTASKFALEGYTEALRIEVEPFGVRVVLIEPGNFRSGFTANRRRTLASSTNPAYRQSFETALSKAEQAEVGGADPLLIARLIERVANHSKPKLRYTVGPLGERLGIGLKKVLPYSFFELLNMRFYGLKK